MYHSENLQKMIGIETQDWIKCMYFSSKNNTYKYLRKIRVQLARLWSWNGGGGAAAADDDDNDNYYDSGLVTL